MTTHDYLNIPDATYIIWPDGGAWLAVAISRGVVIDRTEASLQSTHDAAGDRWAGFDPHENVDIDVDYATAQAVLSLADMEGAEAVVERYRG